MTRDLADSFDLRNLPPDFYDDPFRSYRALREYAPVKRLPDGRRVPHALRRCDRRLSGRC
ncbi:MAG: hypothetical protein WDM89_06625 [Rhizomicrobium sp.]